MDFSSFEALCELAKKANFTIRAEITARLIKFLDEYCQESRNSQQTNTWVCHADWIKALCELGACVETELRQRIIKGLSEIVYDRIYFSECRLLATDCVGCWLFSLKRSPKRRLEP